MSNPLREWRQRFLDSRDLRAPTGLPLYTYRLTSAEFADLETVLKTSLDRYLMLGTLGEVVRQVSFFPALFVLYAAEWWRRRYDGSGWSWEPILSAIDVPTDSWTPVQRSACVEKGLREWNLQLIRMQGFYYLGSVAIQGGLPMQMLSAARGNIGRILARVLRLASTGNVEADDVRDWVESLSQDLPHAYRRGEIYLLLAEVILTVLKLKQEAKLDTAEGAVSRLDAWDPAWRRRFPIPVEDAHAQGLIEQLVRDVAVVRIVQHSRKFVVTRRLVENNHANWEIESEVELAEYLAAEELARAFGIDAHGAGDLPQRLTVRFDRGSDTSELAIRKLAGQERYRVDRQPLNSVGSAAVAEHTMSLIAPDGRVWSSAVPGGASLSTELPWTFEPVPDRTDTFRLARQGSASVSSLEGLLCVPRAWTIEQGANGSAAVLGDCQFGDRRVWGIGGNIQCSDGEHSFRVRCGRADAGDDEFEWRGSRLWEMKFDHKLAFRGFPQLSRISQDGIAHPARGQIKWRIPGGQFTNVPSHLTGPVEAVWPAIGEVVEKARMVVLPVAASFRLEPGPTPQEGRFRFCGWALVSAQVLQEGVVSMGYRDGDDYVVNLRYEVDSSPPESCELALLWQGNPTPVRVTLPFPSGGCRFFDAEGHTLPNESRLAVENTHGVRLVAYMGGAYSASLDLTLCQGRHVLSSRTTAIRPVPGQYQVELRLVDHLVDIERLLADSDAIDDEVRVDLRVSGFPPSSIRVCRYAFEAQLLPDVPGLGVSHNAIPTGESIATVRDTLVRALRLDAPGDQAVELLEYDAPEMAVAWRFPGFDRDPGPWLIYPEPGAKLGFRPVCWDIAGLEFYDHEAMEPGLGPALRIIDGATRATALATALDCLADDFQHPDWNLVGQLANQLGHLPLAALDIWRRLAKSTRIMASVAMRFQSWPPGFINRFSTNMPWMWERVSLETWIGAIRAAKDQCESAFPNEVGFDMFKLHLKRRTEDLASVHTSLNAILEVAKVKATGTMSQDVIAGGQPAIDQYFQGLLFDGPDSQVQRLLRRNAETQWPDGFRSDFAAARTDWRSPYLSPNSYGFHDPVINLPILVALAAAKGSASWDPDQAADGALRSFHSFDPEWFSEAFDRTIARCLARGDITIE